MPVLAVPPSKRVLQYRLLQPRAPSVVPQAANQQQGGRRWTAKAAGQGSSAAQLARMAVNRATKPPAKAPGGCCLRPGRPDGTQPQLPAIVSSFSPPECMAGKQQHVAGVDWVLHQRVRAGRHQLVWSHHSVVCLEGSRTRQQSRAEAGSESVSCRTDSVVCLRPAERCSRSELMPAQSP